MPCSWRAVQVPSHARVACMPYTAGAVEAAFGTRFKISGTAGAGAQGTVFTARRTLTPAGAATDDRVALKVYEASAETARIDREIAMLQRVRHRALATVLEHGEVLIAGATIRFVVWEFISGQSLDVLLQAGPSTPALVARIGRDVAAAVEQIWGQEVVHRDIKPGNIMVRSDAQTAVLIDLGVARHLTAESLTAFGATWGTPGYMSPEQTRAERQLTCKSDLFSLGVTLQEALVGQHPTGGDQARLATHPPRTGAIAPHAPAGLATIIDSLLQVRPAFRPEPSAVSADFERLSAIL